MAVQKFFRINNISYIISPYLLCENNAMLQVYNNVLYNLISLRYGCVLYSNIYHCVIETILNTDFCILMFSKQFFYFQLCLNCKWRLVLFCNNCMNYNRNCSNKNRNNCKKITHKRKSSSTAKPTTTANKANVKISVSSTKYKQEPWCMVLKSLQTIFTNINHCPTGPQCQFSICTNHQINGSIAQHNIVGTMAVTSYVVMFVSFDRLQKWTLWLLLMILCIFNQLQTISIKNLEQKRRRSMKKLKKGNILRKTVLYLKSWQGLRIGKLPIFYQ